jgi:outer membrane protein OmpA-like peptidoglycan-associated protein
MQRTFLGGLLVATAAVASTAAGAAPGEGDDVGSFYVSPMAEYSLMDDKRLAGDAFGFQAGLGVNVAPHAALELNYGDIRSKLRGYPSNQTPSERFKAFSLDALFKFLPPAAPIRPYVVLGAGEMDDTTPASTSAKQAWLAEGGLGMLAAVGPQTSWARLHLRAEAKYRREFIQNTTFIPNNPGDVLFGVGFQLNFGSRTPPPVAAAPPPPPPPAPPAPPLPPAPKPECHPPTGFKVDENCRIIQQTLVVRAIDFEFNSAELTAPAKQTLDEIAAALASQPELDVDIKGYTDSTGSAAYNLKLSQRRAEAVKSYLASKSVNPANLTARGYGKADPIASNNTTEGRALNRRVEFEVTNAPAGVKVITKEATPEDVDAAKKGEPERAKREHH